MYDVTRSRKKHDRGCNTDLLDLLSLLLHTDVASDAQTLLEELHARLHVALLDLGQTSLLERLLALQLFVAPIAHALQLLHLLVVPRQHLVALEEEEVFELARCQLMLLLQLLLLELPDGSFARCNIPRVKKIKVKVSRHHTASGLSSSRTS